MLRLGEDSAVVKVAVTGGGRTAGVGWEALVEEEGGVSAKGFAGVRRDDEEEEEADELGVQERGGVGFGSGFRGTWSELGFP